MWRKSGSLCCKLAVVFLAGLAAQVASANTVEPFSYVQAGQGQGGYSCTWNESDDVTGETFAASWQFADQWVIAGTHFDSGSTYESCSETFLTAKFQSLTMAYLFATNRRTDWYVSAGALHRDYFEAARHHRNLSLHTRERYDHTDPLLTAGGRHGLGRFFEARWDVGAIGSTDVDPYFSGSIRWLFSERFSVGFQASMYGITVGEVNLRYRF